VSTVLSVEVENIDSIDSAPHRPRGLMVEMRLSEGQMLDLLTKINEVLPAEKWQAWLDEDQEAHA